MYKVPEHAVAAGWKNPDVGAVCTSVVLLYKGEVTVIRSYKRILYEH